MDDKALEESVAANESEDDDEEFDADLDDEITKLATAVRKQNDDAHSHGQVFHKKTAKHAKAGHHAKKLRLVKVKQAVQAHATQQIQKKKVHHSKLRKQMKKGHHKRGHNAALVELEKGHKEFINMNKRKS